MTRLAARLGHAGAVATAALLALALLAPALDMVPLWDGRIYAWCAQQVARGDWAGLRCANHPTHAWSLWMALPQRLAFGSTAALHLASWALLVVALDGTARVLRRALPGEQHAAARWLALLAVAAQPALLATVLHTNPDLGVAAFALAALGQMADRRWAVAALFGGAAAFAKETGVAVYGLFALLAAWAEWRAAPAEARWQALRPLAVLLAPPVLYVGVAWVRLRAGADAVWRVVTPGSRGLVELSLDPADPILHNTLALVGILGFTWLVSAVALTDGVAALARWVRGQPRRVVPGAHREWTLVVAAALALGLAGLSSLRTFGNVRYYAPLLPLLVTVATISLVRLAVPWRVRHAVQLAWVAAFAVAAWRSVDPLSRAVWGTFAAGPRPFYAMTSVTGECCGRGRDQLAYNLEFAFFDRAQSEAFSTLGLTSATTVVVPQGGAWFLFAQLDPTTRRRSLAWEGTLLPRYADDATVAVERPFPADVLVLDLPNVDAQRRDALWARYDEVGATLARGHGHAMPARRLRLKPDVAP